MARPIDGEEIPWFELGIFKWFNFAQETIKEFSIDPKASTIVRKEVRMKQAQQYVAGTCKTCGQKSRGSPLKKISYTCPKEVNFSKFLANYANFRQIKEI
jgi:hypothetical protein